MTEQDIYEGILAQNPKVLKHIYDLMYPRIKAHVQQNSGTGNDALDVFQEAMMRFLGIVQNGRYQQENWQGYLFGICKHVWYNISRKRKKMPGMEHIDIEQLAMEGESIVWEFFDITPIVDLIREKLEKISTVCKKLLVQYYFEKRKQVEIAEEMGYTPGSIRQKAMKCKEELKKHVEKDPRYRDHLS